MDIFSISFKNWDCIEFTVNWFAIVVFLILIAIATYVIKRVYEQSIFRTITIEEATIGIGNSSVTIKYDSRIREIAYKIWIELTTRKIGIRFDEEYDVISEVYDSWYEAFRVIRSQLEDIPPEKIKDAKGLIELTTNVLNNGLRPHLTKWQAMFRAWYYEQVKSQRGKTPQEVQRAFPEYQKLVNDLKKTNEIMIKYAEELNRLINSA